MERKLGEIFTCNEKLYQVVKGFSCNGCAFIKNGNCYLINELLGPCGHTKRTDKTNVIFKEINNMEIKNNQLTIEIPEGMEIDLENSDLANGIVKFKKNNITLEDIPCIIRDDIKINGLISKGSIYYNYLKKLKAIATLIDIANYYNKGWKPSWNNNEELKYYIVLDCYYNIYRVKDRAKMNSNIIYFAHEEDAQTVIDNPNFRDILNAVYKN